MGGASTRRESTGATTTPDELELASHSERSSESEGERWSKPSTEWDAPSPRSPCRRSRYADLQPLVSPSAADRCERHRPVLSDGLDSPCEHEPGVAVGPVSPWGRAGPRSVFEALRAAPDDRVPLSPQAVAADLRELQRAHQREIEELTNRAAQRMPDLRLALYADGERWG